MNTLTAKNRRIMPRHTLPNIHPITNKTIRVTVSNISIQGMEGAINNIITIKMVEARK